MDWQLDDDYGSEIDQYVNEILMDGNQDSTVGQPMNITGVHDNPVDACNTMDTDQSPCKKLAMDVSYLI